MKRAFLFMIVLATAACGRSHEGDEQVGSVAFKALPGWQRTDTQGRGTATAVFTPASNGRKESITVTRTEPPRGPRGESALAGAKLGNSEARRTARHAKRRTANFVRSVAFIANPSKRAES